MTIRPATGADREALSLICRKTGDAGQDASGLYGDDALVGDVYATPYLEGPGSFALVWVDETASSGTDVDHTADTPCGYVVGTDDTRAFQAWFSQTWWPSVATQYRPVTESDHALLHAAADQQRMLTAVVDDYPAHLHIDLLPQVQGQGAGRRLIESACALLADRGVRGVHLVVDPRNAAAAGFYERVGFLHAEGQPPEVWVRSLG